jgi:hypothetical protein
MLLIIFAPPCLNDYTRQVRMTATSKGDLGENQSLSRVRIRLTQDRSELPAEYECILYVVLG